MKSPYLRKSMLEAWITCPKKYELMFLKKAPVTTTIPMQVGTLFHKYAKEFFTRLDYDELMEIDDLKEPLLREKLFTFLGRHIPNQRILQPLCTNFVHFEISRWLQLLAMYDDPLFYFKPVALEQNIFVTKLHMKGTIDRIDRLSSGNLVVVEYKTGAKFYYRNLRRELAFYSILANASRIYDVPVTHLGAYNPRLDQGFCEIISNYLLQATKRRINQFHRSNEIGQHDYRVGHQCGYCIVLRPCLEERGLA